MQWSDFESEKWREGIETHVNTVLFNPSTSFLLRLLSPFSSLFLFVSSRGYLPDMCAVNWSVVSWAVLWCYVVSWGVVSWLKCGGVVPWAEVLGCELKYGGVVPWAGCWGAANHELKCCVVVLCSELKCCTFELLVRGILFISCTFY